MGLLVIALEKPVNHVTVEVQGQHGVNSQPPVGELEEILLEWLDSLWPNFPESLSCSFQVRCLRENTTKNAPPVKFVSRPEDNTSAIKVRVKVNNVDTWSGYLVFPTSEVRDYIWAIKRPLETSIILKTAEIKQEPINPLNYPHRQSKGGWDRTKKNIYRQRGLIQSKCYNEETQKEICAAIALVQDNQTEAIGFEQIEQFAKNFFRIDLPTKEEFIYLLGILIDANLLESCNDDDPLIAEDKFAPTEHFYERLAARAKDKERKKEAERLQLIDSHDRKIDSSDQMIIRLEAELEKEIEKRKVVITKERARNLQLRTERATM